jgi:hypothetical protein
MWFEIKWFERTRSVFSARSVSLETPANFSPGSLLGRLAEVTSSQDTFKRVLQPILADMQFEYRANLDNGGSLKAYLVYVDGCFRFWNTWLLHWAATAINSIMKIVP